MSLHVWRWYKRLPPRDKQSLLTSLVFLVVLAFLLALTITEKHFNDQIRRTAVFPGFIAKLGHLAAAIGAEAETAVTFAIHSTNEALYEEMVKTQAETDSVYEDVFMYVQQQKALHAWDGNGLFGEGGTMMSEQGLGPLLYVRSQLAWSEVVFDSQTTRSRYLEVVRRISSLMGTCAHIFKEDVDYTAMVTANALMGIVSTFLSVEGHMQLYQYYADLQVADPTMGDKAAAELKTVLLTLLTYQSISTSVLRPLMELPDILLLDAKSAAFDLDHTIYTFLAEATKQQFLPNDLAVLEHNSIAAVRRVMLKLTDSSDAQWKAALKASLSSKYYLYLACTALCGLAFLVSVIEFLCLRLFEAKGSALRRRSAGVMHDVLVRVSEYVEEIATLSLAPKLPPLTMSDRRVSIVEMELMYLLGKLKTIASSLPPLLFPNHLRALAFEYSDVKDPATMVLAPAPRDSLQNKKMHIQSSEDPHPYLQALAEKTDLQEHICEAALLFVSLTAFHDLGSAEKRKFASDYYQKTVSLVEECVFQHGGVMQSVSFDKAVAIWNAEDADENGLMEDAYGHKAGFCELAATCGLALAGRLNILRMQKPLVRDNFPLHIGIVGGTVNVGVFGSEAAKAVGVFGPPVLRGMLVAQANGFHMTSVACDDYICHAIQRMCFCKPIELLPCGGCAYQVLSESTHDESDLEMQLLTYTKAFELFENRRYKGALKAFRAYTKQYGYDSSVERIQFLITNLQL